MAILVRPLFDHLIDSILTVLTFATLSFTDLLISDRPPDKLFPTRHAQL